MLKKILGILFLTFIGLPSLVMVIWSIGLTKTITSAEFLSDLPIQLINRAPELIDLFDQEILQNPEIAEDLNQRIWLAAIAKVEPSPRELLTTIGVFEWMNNVSLTLH